jgi:ReqiPepy6 Gp37-like protein
VDVYILDSLLRRDSLVDKYLSFIWTERFAAYGDFELVLLSTPSNRRLFTTGVLLACSESYYVMKVTTLEDNTDGDGKATLKVSGVSLEQMLEDRVAAGILDDTTTVPNWTITNTPGAISRKIFHDICVTGILDPGDVIPYIVEGSFLPDDNIPEPLEPITVNLEPQSVYEAIKNICDTWSLGFRILRNADLSQLYFDIYSGSDRTTLQTILPAVVFSPELESLQNTTELKSIANYKNVAYVFGPAGYVTVYPADVNPDTAGFERHVLMVNASDIGSDNPDVTAAMTQRGLEALAQQRSFSAFDGEINPNSTYKYGTHYFLGDLVEMRNTDGVTNQMRVTEQIFVSDGEGERTYPTLAIALFIETGSWFSWEASQVWEDMGLTEYWEDQ